MERGQGFAIRLDVEKSVPFSAPGGEHLIRLEEELVLAIRMEKARRKGTRVREEDQ